MSSWFCAIHFLFYNNTLLFRTVICTISGINIILPLTLAARVQSSSLLCNSVGLSRSAWTRLFKGHTRVRFSIMRNAFCMLKSDGSTWLTSAAVYDKHRQSINPRSSLSIAIKKYNGHILLQHFFHWDSQSWSVRAIDFSPVCFLILLPLYRLQAVLHSLQKEK